jgi:hypothetical protein
MMKRHFLAIAAAFALAAILPGAGSLLYAQQSAGAGEAEADRSESAGDATAEREQPEAGTQSDAGQADQPSTGSDADQPATETETQPSTDDADARGQANEPADADAQPDAGTPRQEDRQRADTESATVPPPDAPGRDQDAARATQNDQDADAQFDRRSGDRPIDRRDARDSARDRTDGSFRDRDGRRDGRRGDLRRDVNLGISFSVGVSGRGLTIDNIDQTSVFFDSGLRRGDVIISVFGRPVRSEVDFVTFVRTRPGARIPVVVLRDGREETIYVTYEREIDQPETTVDYQEQPATGGPGFLGVMFEVQVPNAALIRSVLPGSPAEQAGLRAGDEIVALNGEPVSSYADAVQRIGMMRAGEPLGIAFMRPVESQTEALLAPRPASGVRTANRPIDMEAGVAPPPGAIDQPREIRPAPAPENRGRSLIQPNRPRPLLSPLRN